MSSRIRATATLFPSLLSGYCFSCRFDIWDETTRLWRSLCRRAASYRVGGAVTVEPLAGEEEGTVRLATTTSPDGSTNQDLIWLHEAIAKHQEVRWSGAEGSELTTLMKETLKGAVAGKPKKERARAIGKAIGDKLLALNIKAVVFDRNGYIYHGRVKEVADGARDAGLTF